MGLGWPLSSDWDSSPALPAPPPTLLPPPTPPQILSGSTARPMVHQAKTVPPPRRLLCFFGCPSPHFCAATQGAGPHGSWPMWRARVGHEASAGVARVQVDSASGEADAANRVAPSAGRSRLLSSAPPGHTTSNSLIVTFPGIPSRSVMLWGGGGGEGGRRSSRGSSKIGRD